MKKIPKRFVKNDILDRNYFNFNNCVEKMQRYKLSVYRDLSRIGRTMCV